MKRPAWVAGLASALEDPTILEQGGIEVDGLRPQITARPRNVEDVAVVMAYAHDEGLRVVPVGGGTALHLGNRPKGVDVLLSLKRLRENFEHSPDDLVATLPAGMTVGGANGNLEKSGQGLPLDPPKIEDATIGGTLAANSIGPRIQWFGMPRGWVLGMTVVLADGSITKAGGKVVKNVTGYDLARAYVGCLGTLGVIVDATLRLQPLPQTLVTMVLNFPTLDGVIRTSEGILEGGLDPLAVSALDSSAVASLAIDDHAALLVEFGGPEHAVARQVGEARRMAEERGAIGVVMHRGDSGRDLWRGVADLPCNAWVTVLRTTLPLASVGAFLDAIPEAYTVAGLRGSLLAHLGRGVVYAGTTASLRGDQLASLFAEFSGVASSMGGHAIVEKTRPELKEGLDVWGLRPDAFGVMERLKAEFDDRGVLNPGRYVGGL